MKKLLKIIVVAVMTALIGLGSAVKAQKTPEELIAENNQKNKDSKVLIAFFSNSGITQYMAIQMANILNAYIYKITPQQPYTRADLNYQDTNSRTTLEQRDSTARPAIGSPKIDMSKYDVVYIGFPVWWNSCPRIINTFIESYNFKDKVLVPFATSAGTTMKVINDELQRVYPYPKYIWKDGEIANSMTPAQIWGMRVDNPAKAKKDAEARAKAKAEANPEEEDALPTPDPMPEEGEIKAE